MTSLRVGFRQIAAQRRLARSHRASLADRFLIRDNGSGSPSSSSSDMTEEELRRALGAALGSLTALGGIYDQREARWREEMRRISEDRERIEMLLKQALGEGRSLSGGSASGSAMGSPSPGPRSPRIGNGGLGQVPVYGGGIGNVNINGSGPSSPLRKEAVTTKAG